MRFPIRISTIWRSTFTIFGFTPESSYLDIEDEAVTFHFGTAHERVPIGDIISVEPRSWPFYFGLGPKMGPDGGVSYVGSTEGVLRFRLKNPLSLNVWGFFHHPKAESITVSVEDPEGVKNAINEKISKSKPSPQAETTK